MTYSPRIRYTPAQWYNSAELQVSYKRIYKSASSSIVSLLGPEATSTEPVYPKTFSVIRDPLSRSYSIFKELTAIRKVTGTYSEYLDRTEAEGFIDKHQFPQSFWLQEAPEDILLFRLESLPDLLTWLNLPTDRLPAINVRPGQHHHTTVEAYIVTKLYAEDFYLIDTLTNAKKGDHAQTT